MGRSYDVIVLGTGGMGSSALLSLAKRKVRVLGLDQFDRVHSFGSSHGNTRIIRKAYFEDQQYIPLLERVYPLWDELGAHCGRQLFHRVGLLIIGDRRQNRIMKGVADGAEKYGLSLLPLDSKEIEGSYPQFSIPPEFEGLLEPDAGYLEVENCVREQLNWAEELGAEIRTREKVLKWKEQGSRVSVTTDRGTYECDKLVITAGAWSSEILGAFGMTLTVRRAPQFWFDATPGHESIPCFAFAIDGNFIYGFPSIKDVGLKVAQYEADGIVSDPSSLDREWTEEMFSPIHECLCRFLPGVTPEVKHYSMCMYTLTQDENFVIDHYPGSERVFIGTGGSGHAYKFTPILGQALADLSLKGETELPIGFLRLRSFPPA